MRINWLLVHLKSGEIEVNSLKWSWPFHDGGPCHIETSLLICSANQWAGFYMITAFKGQTLTFQKSCFIYLNGSPLIMMKNAFYFILKAFFFLKIFKSLSLIFGQAEKIEI